MGSSNVTLYAEWTALPTYTVTYNGNGSTGGTVPVDSNSYLTSDTVIVLGNTGSLEKTGYTFAGWNTQADGSGTAYTEGSTFTMGSSNVTLYAEWTALPTYTVTYNGNGSTGGTVPVDSSSYLTSDTVTVLGNTGNLEKTGYTFAGWNTQADGLGTTYAAGDSFDMGTADVILYAQWMEIQTSGYLVSVSADPTEGGIVTGGGYYETGDRVKVTATAKEYYAFVHWTEGSTVVSKGETYTFRMGREKRYLVAHFVETETADEWLVTVSAKHSEGGTVDGEGWYQENETVQVSATASEGYRFINWTEGQTEVSTDAFYSFTMGTSERSLTANFLAEGSGWPKGIRLSATNITATSVTLVLSQPVPDATKYKVYRDGVLYRAFDYSSYAAMLIDGLDPLTSYTFTVQALYGDGETSDGPSVKVKAKK